ncbi:hypothetical protein NC652_006206 [Populus alba x Populus x berolinensis]|nr:hypothetical protein NC652_006206 [Populus alba x Populus x berolinensis]
MDWERSMFGTITSFSIFRFSFE